MFVMQEFELFEEDGYIIAVPFDLEGATQGYSFEDAAEMAADWLKCTAEDLLIRDIEPPKATIGNEPTHGGRVILIGVDVSRESIPTMSASEAADTLGVSRPRITQMLASGALVGWKDGRNTRVTVDSVNARRGHHDYLHAFDAETYLKAKAEYEANPVGYSLEEVSRMLDL